MVNWLIVGIIVLAFFIFIKTTGFRYGKSITYFVGAILLFFAVTLIYVLAIFPVELSSFDNITEFVGVYFAWLGNFFSTTSNITGNVIKEYSGNVSNFTR